MGRNGNLLRLKMKGILNQKKKNEGREKYEDAHKLKKEKEKKNKDLNSLW